jgi:hypothetical protein
VKFLTDLLEAKGAVAVKDIKEAADAECIAPKTLRDAKEHLRIVAYQPKGAGASPGFYWRLPNDHRPDPAGDFLDDPPEPAPYRGNPWD